MYRSLRRIVQFICVLGVPLMAFTVAHAGGFFAAEGGGVGVAELRALFAVDESEQRTTMILEYALEGAADTEFGVIVPLPTEPEDVALEGGRPYVGAYPWHITINSVFDWVFERPHARVINEPSNACGGLVTDAVTCPHLYRGTTEIIEEGPASTYEILPDMENVMAWIHQHDYVISEAEEEILSQYAARDMVFLALRAEMIEPGWDWLPQISVTYPGTDLVLPLQLMAVPPGSVTVQLAVLAEQPYTIENFTQVAPNYSQMHHVSPLQYGLFRYSEQCNSGYIGHYSPLERQISQAFNEVSNSLAYMVEYAGSSQILLDGELNDEALTEVQTLVDGFPYLTLMYLGPIGSETVDPTIVPDPDAIPVSNVIDVEQYDVEPMSYWRCSSPILYGVEVNETQLPDARTYVDTLGKMVYHPEGWTRSELTITVEDEHCSAREFTLEALAPEAVTIDDLKDLLLDEGEVFPIMLFTSDLSSMWLYRYFGLRPTGGHNIWVSESRVEPFSEISSLSCPSSGFRKYAFLATTDDDWETFQAMYSAMVKEAVTYDYYVHPDLKNTAFLTSKEEMPPRQGHYGGTIVGYPENWEAHTTSDDAEFHWFVPAGASYDDAVPRLSIVGGRTFLELASLDVPDMPVVFLQEYYEAIIGFYGLQDEVDPVSLQIRLTTPDEQLTFEEHIIPFEREGRRGFIDIGVDVIEVSAPVVIFEQYEDLLLLMMREIRHSCACP